MDDIILIKLITNIAIIVLMAIAHFVFKLNNLKIEIFGIIILIVIADILITIFKL
jgi:hypothetical protein